MYSRFADGPGLDLRLAGAPGLDLRLASVPGLDLPFFFWEEGNTSVY